MKTFDEWLELLGYELKHPQPCFVGYTKEQAIELIKQYKEENLLRKL